MTSAKNSQRGKIRRWASKHIEPSSTSSSSIAAYIISLSSRDIEGIKRAFDDTSGYLPRHFAKLVHRYWPNSKTARPSEGKWILARGCARIESDLIQLTTTISPFSDHRQNRNPRNLRCFSFMTWLVRFTPKLRFSVNTTVIYRAKSSDTPLKQL